MKRARLIISFLGLLGLATTNYACSGAFVREVRDAAISGVAGFVEGEVGTLLADAVGP